HIEDELNSHFPFHLVGGGDIPWPLNEGCEGNTPPSSTPMITPFPKFASCDQNPPSCCCCRPRNLGLCVVCRLIDFSGRADMK
ncbi:hypothetical protein LINGRAHAP2_LOCUS24804, partial [Linum grandiflorum]